MSKKVTFDDRNTELIAEYMKERNMWFNKFIEAEKQLKELKMFCLLFVVGSFLYWFTTTTN